ncbi:unnamed protein product [Agarophyton chilense]
MVAPLHSSSTLPKGECSDSQENAHISASESVYNVTDSHDPRFSSNQEVMSHETNLAKIVYSFFKENRDTSSPLYPSIKKSNSCPEELHPWCQEILDHCNREQFTLGQTRSEAELVLRLERHISEENRHLSNLSRNSDAFTSYVDNVRKWKVRNENWRQASIETSFGTNETGVFRSTLELMMEEVETAGGAASVQSFTANNKQNERRYSAPWNSRMIGKYSQNNGPNVVIVAIDLYCDGTILSKSGSQNVSTLRVRFNNLKGRSNEWHEVGIAPCVDSNGTEHSALELRRERLQLFQRFLFLALKDLIDASNAGIVAGDAILLSRICMVVADQPQESAFFCLKNADSYKDCTLCEMPFKRSAEDPEFVDPVVAQTSAMNFPSRDVSKTIQYQLIAARQRLQNAKPKRSLNENEKQNLDNARIYWRDRSAHEFPPALAAFQGLGSFPFLLYETIAFDTLHVIGSGDISAVARQSWKMAW